MEIAVEAIPFSFKTKNTGLELKAAPMAYVNDLKTILLERLAYKKYLPDRLGQLTYHDGMISKYGS